MTRLQSLYAPQQTTGDSKGSDYDYSFEDESDEPTHFDLSLIPLNDANETTTSSNLPTAESFRESDDADDNHTTASDTSTAQFELIKGTVELDETTEQNASAGEEDPAENSASLYSTTTAESVASLEEVDTTSPETSRFGVHDDISHVEDQFNESDNYTTASSELVINKSESFDELTEKTISDSGGTLLDEYLDATAANESLMYEGSTDFDYDVTTAPSSLSQEVEQTEREEHNNSTENVEIFAEDKIGSTTELPTALTTHQPHENRIINDDKQDSELENAEVSNKFVYHHLSATDDEFRATARPAAFIRFPEEDANDGRRQRVKFPEERFSWPRDNGYMQFWQDQPLINDFKFYSRGNSIGNYHTRSS